MKMFANKNQLLKKAAPATPYGPPKYRIPLPGFVSQKEVGLGTIIQGVTSAAGIKPCADCKKRMVDLNSRIVFGRNKRK